MSIADTLTSIIDKMVEVEWKRLLEDPWTRFRVEAIDATMGWIKLQGVGTGTATYAGGPIWASLDSIESIEEIHQGAETQMYVLVNTTNGPCVPLSELYVAGEEASTYGTLAKAVTWRDYYAEEFENEGIKVFLLVPVSEAEIEAVRSHPDYEDLAEE